MGYYLTTEPEIAVPPKSCEQPKTHVPASPVKDRGHRYYMPADGRWVSRDPLGEAAFYKHYSVGKIKSESRILTRNSLRPAYVFAENSSIGAFDFLGLYGEGPPYCPDLIEKCSDVLACGVSNSRIAAALYERAKAEAETRYPGRGHRDVGDAWRHCYWSCEMARTVGARCARIIGENHEACGDRHGQPSNENRMDSHNNAVGRRYALMRGSCADLCANGPAENP